MALTLSQRKLVSQEIRKEFKRQKMKPKGLRRSRKQIIAIGFSKARKINPRIPEQDPYEY